MIFRKTRTTAQVPDISALLGAVDDAREQIATLCIERDNVTRSPRPLEETLDLLEQYLDAAATDAVDALHIDRMMQRGAPVGLDLPFFLDPTTRQIDSSRATRTVLGLVIATCRPVFREIVQGQLEDLLRDQPGMTDAAQAERLAELNCDILKVELVEEAAIRQLEVAGMSVLRRPDAAPLALLAADGALPAL